MGLRRYVNLLNQAMFQDIKIHGRNSQQYAMCSYLRNVYQVFVVIYRMPCNVVFCVNSKSKALHDGTRSSAGSGTSNTECIAFRENSHLVFLASSRLFEFWLTHRMNPQIFYDINTTKPNSTTNTVVYHMRFIAFILLIERLFVVLCLPLRVHGFMHFTHVVATIYTTMAKFYSAA